jgi:hypothetical protein
MMNENGNQLPNVTTAEDVLTYVRNRRKERESELNVNAERDSSASNTLLRKLPTNQSSDRTNESESNGGTSTVYRPYGSNEYISTSQRVTNIENGQSNRTTGRRDASIYQYETSGGSTRKTATTITGKIKNVLTPLKEYISNRKDVSDKDKKKPKDGRKLSDLEAAKLKPKIIEFVTWTSDHLDEALTAITKGHEEIIIWSNLDETEIEIIADFLISRGKKSEQAAILVRNMAVFIERVQLSLIVIPRMYLTAKILFEKGISLK